VDANSSQLRFGRGRNQGTQIADNWPCPGSSRTIGYPWTAAITVKYMQTLVTETKSVANENRNDIFDFLLVFAKRKRLIFCLPLAVGALTAAISLMVPDVYQAGTRILPPQQSQSSASALLSQLGGMTGGLVGASSLKNPNDLYIGMLRSRAVSDGIIKQFGLLKHYGTESPEKARRILAENTLISSGKDGLIEVLVEDKDQKLVSSLANAYISELFKLSNVLAVTEAAQRRLFFERQLESAKVRMESAEVALKNTIDTRGVISVDSDSRAVVETVARLRARISAKEIELDSMSAFVTPSHQDYKRVKEELASLHSELSKLENGRPEVLAEGKGDQHNAGLASVKVLRDLKYAQMLYELLAKQYEMARLDEAKEAPIIQVLDSAIEPEHKFKPKRLTIVIVATVLAFCAALAWAIVADLRHRLLADPNRTEKLDRLKSALRN
jgi:tyrosine-protein kinase Etk/Wzc